MMNNQSEPHPVIQKTSIKFADRCNEIDFITIVIIVKFVMNFDNAPKSSKKLCTRLKLVMNFAQASMNAMWHTQKLTEDARRPIRSSEFCSNTSMNHPVPSEIIIPVLKRDR
jgi:hypothetical protein